MNFSPDRLRGHRNGHGLTLAELAARVGRSAETLKSYETGRAEPPSRVLGALATELGVSIDELFARHDDPIFDYVDAVAQHVRRLTPEEVEGAAVVVRAMRAARLNRATPATECVA